MAGVSLKNLVRSSAVAWLAEVWRIGSRLILTPLILAQIGKEGYGVWTLVFSLSEYVSMMNSSFGLAYVRATAACSKVGDRARLEQVLAAGMTTIGGVAVAVALAMVWLGRPVLGLINVPGELIDEGWIALLFVMASLVVRMTWGCTLEVLSGLHRADLTYRLYILGSVVEFCVTLPLLWAGYGLVGMGLGYFLGQVACVALARVVVARHAPGLRINPFLCSKAGFREVLHAGGRFQLLGVVNTTVMQGLKILLSVILGVTAVAIYDLADKLVNLGRSLASSILAPLMPAFADLQTGQEVERERALFAQASKALALVSCATFGFLAAMADPVLLAWTNQEVHQAAVALQLLAIGEVFTLQTGVVSANLRAQGKVRTELTAALVATFGIAVLALPLFSLMGFYGVILARTLSQVAAGLWYLGAYFRLADLTWRGYFTGARLVRVAVVVVVAAAAAVAVHMGLAPWLDELKPRWAAAWLVIAAAVPYGVAVAAGGLAWVLSADERGRLMELVRGKLGRAARG